MAEFKLYNNKTEQEMYEGYADLYAIVQTLEKLERAFVRDACTAPEYETACIRLLGQYRTLWSALRSRCAALLLVPDLDRFMGQYQLQCPLASTRIEEGLPATQVHAVGRAGAEAPAGGVRAVADATAHFITAMDSLKLNMGAVDQVVPILSDLVASMNRIPGLAPDFGPREKVKSWYAQLHTLPAAHELPEGQARQLAFDLEQAFSEFTRSLK